MNKKRRKLLRKKAIRMLMRQNKQRKTIRNAYKVAWLIEERRMTMAEAVKKVPVKCKSTLRGHYRQYEMKRGFAMKGESVVIPRVNGMVRLPQFVIVNETPRMVGG